MKTKLEKELEKEPTRNLTQTERFLLRYGKDYKQYLFLEYVTLNDLRYRINHGRSKN